VEKKNEILTNLLSAIQECSDWFEANGLLLNLTKTSAINFHLSKRSENIENDITIGDNSKIAITSEVKFLGIILDESLSWIPHITELIKRLSSASYAINLLKGTCSKSTCAIRRLQGIL